MFVSKGQDGTPRLFTRRLDQGKATQLAKTEGADAPFFSPDGQWVGFFAQSKLKKTRIDGGDPVSLCEAPAGRGATWSEDGSIYAALDVLTGLSQIPSGGGKPIPVTIMATGETTHRWPHVLPGGKALLFNASRTYGNHDDGIAAFSLKDRRTKTLIDHAGMFPHYLASGHLIYVSKGMVYAITFDPDRLEASGAAMPIADVLSNSNLASAQLDFSRTGTFAYRTGGVEGLSIIQWLESGGKTETIVAEPAQYNSPRLSPDGSRLAFTVNERSTSDVLIHDLKRGSTRRLTDGIAAAWPVWTPDGQFVVFQSPGGMYWRRADGATGIQPLTRSKQPQLPNAFTPDGRLIFSELNPGGGAEIRILPVQTASDGLSAGEPRILHKTSTGNTVAAVSSDGKWLAYADGVGGTYGVYLRALPDRGTQDLISNAGGAMPMWSRNGYELFYRTEDQRIMVVDYKVKGDSIVAEKPRTWSNRQLANLGLAANLDLEPNGKRFVVLMPAEGAESRERQSHVMLMTNFFDEVHRRMRQGQ